MQAYGKLTPRLKFTLEAGNNNLNYYNEDVWPRILDAFAEYRINNFLSIGGGKHGWTGLSRYAAPGTSTALGYDISFSAVSLMNIYDDLFRRYGIYAHGQVQKWDYRAAVCRPYRHEGQKFSFAEKATASGVYDRLQYSLYVKYQFRDKESQDSPYSPGTWLGEKNILNVGAGILYQPDATATLYGTDTTYHDAKLFAMDLFLEKPLDYRHVFTFYAAYCNNSIGPGFVRNLGVNNPANGHLSTDYYNDHGNSTPVSGTGNLYSIQVALLRSINVRERTFRIQVFGLLDYGVLTGLDDPMRIYQAGVNYFLRNHHSRITLGFQNRPVFRVSDDQKIVEGTRKSMVVLQYQLKIG